MKTYKKNLRIGTNLYRPVRYLPYTYLGRWVKYGKIESYDRRNGWYYITGGWRFSELEIRQLFRLKKPKIVENGF